MKDIYAFDNIHADCLEDGKAEIKQTRETGRFARFRDVRNKSPNGMWLEMFEIPSLEKCCNQKKNCLTVYPSPLVSY